MNIHPRFETGDQGSEKPPPGVLLKIVGCIAVAKLLTAGATMAGGVLATHLYP